MVKDSVAALCDALRQAELLTPEQWAELGNPPSVAFRTVAELREELLRRGWLTRYQIEQASRQPIGLLVVGPYEVLDRLGSGGMGQVYKARHRRLRRIVALKVLDPDPSHDARVTRRFEREAEATAQLSHPHIVTLYEAGQADGIHYLAMEFVEGVTLAQLVETEGPLPLPAACEYIRQAALGLEHAHQLGLIHRDIKPANLLLTGADRLGAGRLRGPAPTGGLPTVPGTIKILDFGLALSNRLTQGLGSDIELTQKGELLGTADYIAPEQAMDSHRVDIRADIYSLGCTFYFLLTGQPPFPEGSLAQKLIWHQLSEPNPVESLRREVPPSLAAMVRRMMAKKPADRFQTPADVANALEAYLRGQPLAAGRPAPRQRPNRRRVALVAPLVDAVVAFFVGGQIWRRPTPVDNVEESEPVPSVADPAGGPAEAAPLAPTRSSGHWTPLFNGVNLAGWEPWFTEESNGRVRVVKEHDPKQVFRVVEEDGQPAIRVSGEVPGALTSRSSFENFHLRLEFKWGRKKWPPYDLGDRRCGLIYHAVESAPAGAGAWLAGLECRIAEGQTGTLVLARELNLSVDTEGHLFAVHGPSAWAPYVQYRSLGQKFSIPLGVPPQVIREADYEFPAGQWNTLEILTCHGASMHRVNGKVNLVVTNTQRWLGLKAEPFQKGRIQLKSEGTEIFFRNILLKPLTQLPEG
ncbi:MAG: protein kinase [Gemmataceae bacterium]|nr:protein kinase [Gemmataceae bacterium]